MNSLACERLFCLCLQIGKKVDDVVRTIAELAARDVRHSSRLLSARHDLTAYECYEPAVELFDQRCFDISQVCPLFVATLAAN